MALDRYAEWKRMGELERNIRVAKDVLGLEVCYLTLTIVTKDALGNEANEPIPLRCRSRVEAALAELGWSVDVQSLPRSDVRHIVTLKKDGRPDIVSPAMPALDGVCYSAISAMGLE